MVPVGSSTTATRRPADASFVPRLAVICAHRRTYLYVSPLSIRDPAPRHSRCWGGHLRGPPAKLAGGDNRTIIVGAEHNPGREDLFSPGAFHAPAIQWAAVRSRSSPPPHRASPSAISAAPIGLHRPLRHRLAVLTRARQIQMAIWIYTDSASARQVHTAWTPCPWTRAHVPGPVGLQLMAGRFRDAGVGEDSGAGRRSAGEGGSVRPMAVQALPLWCVPRRGIGTACLRNCLGDSVDPFRDERLVDDRVS